MGSDRTGSTWSMEEGGLKAGEEASIHLIMRIGGVTQREWESQEDEVPSQLEQVQPLRLGRRQPQICH